MFLKSKESGDLFKITDVEDLFDPTSDRVQGKIQGGQNEQSSESLQKKDLIFPSGEDLPQCWTDSEYRMKSSPQ